MTARIIDLELSGLCLPQNSSLRRRKVGKPQHHDAEFEARFDAHTIFYDCFEDVDEGAVVLIGPPLLNLRNAVEDAEFLVDGIPTPIREIRDLSRTSLVILDRERGHFVKVSHTLFGGNLIIGRSFVDEYSGQNAIYSISLDNKLEWIADWIDYHVRLHGLETVVLSDNGSTAYSPRELRETLASIRGLKSATLLHARFPFGPRAENASAYGALFLQRSLAELARRRFFARARAVLNADVDELFYSRSGRSVFDAAVSSSLGYVRANADWVYAPSPGPHGYARHCDHTHVSRSGRPRANRKWCVVPTGTQAGKQWKTHFIDSNKDPVDPDLGMWHFRQVSNSWKYDRGDLPADLTSSSELTQTMGRAFAHKLGE